MRQLDLVLRDNPPLRVLRLQLERHLHSHRARIAALLAAEDCKWLPQGPGPRLSVGLTADSMIGGPWGVTDFLDTMPLDRGTLQTGTGATVETSRGLAKEHAPITQLCDGALLRIPSTDLFSQREAQRLLGPEGPFGATPKKPSVTELATTRNSGLSMP